MNRNTFIFIGILLFIGVILICFSHFNKQSAQNLAKGEVILKEKVFSVEIADTEKSRERGLSGHSPLLDNQGMIFIFDKGGKYGFWMKDMIFPIDIIWIDENFKINYIENSVLPESYPNVFYPETPSIYVLELSAGQSRVLNLKIGDTLKFLKK